MNDTLGLRLMLRAEAANWDPEGVICPLFTAAADALRATEERIVKLEAVIQAAKNELRGDGKPRLPEVDRILSSEILEEVNIPDIGKKNPTLGKTSINKKSGVE